VVLNARLPMYSFPSCRIYERVHTKVSPPHFFPASHPGHAAVLVLLPFHFFTYIVQGLLLPLGGLLHRGIRHRLRVRHLSWLVLLLPCAWCERVGIGIGWVEEGQLDLFSKALVSAFSLGGHRYLAP
jgi:hypothetical protein